MPLQKRTVLPARTETAGDTGTGGCPSGRKRNVPSSVVLRLTSFFRAWEDAVKVRSRRFRPLQQAMAAHRSSTTIPECSPCPADAAREAVGHEATSSDGVIDSQSEWTIEIVRRARLTPASTHQAPLGGGAHHRLAQPKPPVSPGILRTPSKVLSLG